VRPWLPRWRSFRNLPATVFVGATWGGATEMPTSQRPLVRSKVKWRRSNGTLSYPS